MDICVLEGENQALGQEFLRLQGEEVAAVLHVLLSHMAEEAVAADEDKADSHVVLVDSSRTLPYYVADAFAENAVVDVVVADNGSVQTTIQILVQVPSCFVPVAFDRTCTMDRKAMVVVVWLFGVFSTWTGNSTKGAVCRLGFLH